MEKKELINKLELFSRISFWGSIISGCIILCIALQSCSAGNDASDMFGISEIGSVISGITGFFTLMAVMLMIIGMTVSYIAKAIAAYLKGEFNDFQSVSSSNGERFVQRDDNVNNNPSDQRLII